ncbi:amino acid ABC transporter permease [Tissierella creatinini]|nr:amino acid ABC transporter permease [Tissierella creatinini]TJX63742.1 amino acid ABC transporter permease [Soehngenia saccharolytica]
MGFQFDFFINVFREILPYFKYTILIAIAAFFLSIIFALIISTSMMLNIKGLSRFFKVYISFFRSTPLVSQLFFFYFGLPQIFPAISKLSSMTCLILILSLNEAAFMAEIIRGAFSSIPKGQLQAAKSIGMTTKQAMQHIMIPQVIRIALPGLSNSIICLTKGSAVGFTVGVMEMMTAAKIVTARTYRTMEVYVAVLFVYWAIVIVLTKFQSKLENTLNRGYI